MVPHPSGIRFVSECLDIILHLILNCLYLSPSIEYYVQTGTNFWIDLRRRRISIRSAGMVMGKMITRKSYRVWMFKRAEHGLVSIGLGGLLCCKFAHPIHLLPFFFCGCEEGNCSMLSFVLHSLNFFLNSLHICGCEGVTVRRYLSSFILHSHRTPEQANDASHSYISTGPI